MTDIRNAIRADIDGRTDTCGLNTSAAILETILEIAAGDGEIMTIWENGFGQGHSRDEIVGRAADWHADDRIDELHWGGSLVWTAEDGIVPE